MNLAYLIHPTWLKPEILPGLPFRWYGLMYLVAFGIVYSLAKRQQKQGIAAFSDEELSSCFFQAILGIILGARLLAVTLYDTTGIYLRKPWLIVWPFDGQGNFVGLQGMSYHGGVLGFMLGTFLYCRKHKQNWFKWMDILVAGVPLGYTFGRLGNFINGELWGRVTTLPWGMVFPGAPRFSPSLDWVKEVVEKAGMTLPVAGENINLPRHPSQLYEAFFEGIFLWVLLWFVILKRKKFHGALSSLYIIGYGFVRFLIEYVREPDRDIGFPIELVESHGEIHRLTSFFNFTTGQILCFLMILGGAFCYGLLARRQKLAPPPPPERKLPPSARKRKKKRRR